MVLLPRAVVIAALSKAWREYRRVADGVVVGTNVGWSSKRWPTPSNCNRRGTAPGERRRHRPPGVDSGPLDAIVAQVVQVVGSRRNT